MSDKLVRYGAPALFVGAVAVLACVWVNGNPQLAPPVIQDRVVSAGATPLTAIAWSSTSTTDGERRRRVDAMRASAAEERFASEKMRSAELESCSGLTDDDRDVSPFFYAEDILDVQPLRAHDDRAPGRLEGAVVTFRAVEGLTASRLQRIVDCQSARDAALSFSNPTTAWSPLAVQHVRGHVTRTERGLDVELRVSDADAAVETYSRALALLGSR